MRGQFLDAFEPEVVVNVVPIGSNTKEALQILESLVQFFTTKDYYHLTDSQNSTIYLKKRKKEKN